MRLPPILAETDFCIAELSALRLDGDVFGLGDGYAPSDQVDGEALRAASLTGLLGAERIAVRRTAAWIWGALPSLVRPIDTAVRTGRAQALLPVRGTLLGEIRLEPQDVVTVGGLRVTTPARTVLDLVRDPVDESAATRVLQRRSGLSPAQLLAEVEQPRYQRERQRARLRLAALAREGTGQPAETR